MKTKLKQSKSNRVSMAHLYPLQLAILAVCFVSVHSQFYFHQPIRPVYIVQKPQDPNSNNNNINGPVSPQTQFASRVGHYEHEHEADEEEENNGRINYGNGPEGRSDGLTSSEEEQDQEQEQNDGEGSFENSREFRHGKLNLTELPEGFDDAIHSNRPPLQPRPMAPLYGDPAVEADEQERSRYLWPFSTTVTISKKKHHPSPPHHHHLSHPPGFTPHLFPPHLQHGHAGPHHHKGGHADLEYEKTRLKYEIYKLKAKKTIAILQNKVELKKILSLLLQQKIKALEWVTWYNDYMQQMYNTANGYNDGDGWGEEDWGLTDEEILASKGSQENTKPVEGNPKTNPSKKVKSSRSPKEAKKGRTDIDRSSSTAQAPTQAPSRWGSFFGGGLLNRLRSSLTYISDKTKKLVGKTTGSNSDQQNSENNPHPQYQKHPKFPPPPNNQQLQHKHRIHGQQQQQQQQQNQQPFQFDRPFHLRTSQESEEDENENEDDDNEPEADVVNDNDNENEANNENDNDNETDNDTANDNEDDNENDNDNDTANDNDTDNEADNKNANENKKTIFTGDREKSRDDYAYDYPNKNHYDVMLIDDQAGNEDQDDEAEDLVKAENDPLTFSPEVGAKDEIEEEVENEDADAETEAKTVSGENETDVEADNDDNDNDNENKDGAGNKQEDEEDTDDAEDEEEEEDEPEEDTDAEDTIPIQINNRYRGGVLEGEGGKLNLKPKPKPTQKPTSASKKQNNKLDKNNKKMNLKNSVYSVLFKTMEAIDKRFNDDDDDEKELKKSL